jgi:hypothetical protein
VVLTDLRMPGVGGLALASAFRAERPDVPVVLMSGYAPESTGAATSPHQDPLLAKPFTADELLAVLGDVLRQVGPQPAPAGPLTDAEEVTIGALAYAYTLDAQDRIASMDATWTDFAASNGAPTLPESVVGTKLWQHIADPTTRHLYQLLFREAREHTRELRVPFRCDAPALVREMELAITPTAEHGLLMTVRVLRQRPRAYVPFLDPSVPRTEAFVRMCGWCKRVHLEGRWYELEEAMQVSRLLCEAPMPGVTHGICAACEEAVFTVLE